MQIQTKRVYFIKLDEDEAEDFLYDPEPIQSKLRLELRSENGHTRVASKPAAKKENGGPPRPKAKRKAMAKTKCPECDKLIAAHFLERHRAKFHPSADGAHAAADLSVA